MTTMKPTGTQPGEGNPELVLALQGDAITVLVAALDVAQTTFESLWPLLSPAEQARANRFLGERRRQEFTVGRGRLRQLLAERLESAPTEIEIVAEGHGKPALGGRWASSGLRFNLSHSGGLVVYAFSVGRELGIDVEQLRAMPNASELANRFFAKDESAAVASYPPERRDLAFLSCWTRKEAFVKALGKGMSFPLDRFSVSVDPDVPARIIEVEDTPGPQTGWSLVAFRPRPTHVGAIVFQERH